MTDPNKIPTLAEIEASKDAMDDIASFTYLADDSFVDANGVTRDTVNGRLKKMGYQVAIPYTGGIVFSVSDNTKTVEENNFIYAPFSAALPFTTDGNFSTDSLKFFNIQLDFSTDDGASRVGTASGSTVQEKLDSLSSGQTGGVIVFTTYALLDAYTPADSAEEKTSYKVTNDPTPGNNGYYSWVSGTTYTKDADLAIGVVVDGDPDPVSGDAVFENTKPIKNSVVGLQGSNNIDEIVSNTVMTELMIDENAQFVFIIVDVGVERAYSSSFTGWKTPMIYNGESFQIVELLFGIENEDDVEFSIWDENNILVASTHARISGYGWHRFKLDDEITVSDLGGSVFYASVTSRAIGGGARIMPPASATWPVEEQPDLNVYISQYTTTSNSWTSVTSPPNISFPVPGRFFLLSDLLPELGSTLTLRIARLEPYTYETVDKLTVVTYESAVASAPITSDAPSSRTTEFTGWSADFNRVANESFNLLKIPQVKRGVGVDPSEEWAYFEAYVYDPVGLVYLAKGTFEVKTNPSNLILEDLEFVLKDPLTGLDITLTDANLPLVYRVGYDAFTTSGTRAIVGETKGSAISYEGNSWYRVVSFDSTQFSSFSGNPFIAVERYLAVNPVETVLYLVKEEALPVTPLPVHVPEILLTSTTYMLEGLEGDIYFDNLMGEYVKNYDINVSGLSSPLHQNNRLNVIDSTAAGSYSTTIEVINPNDGKVLASATTTLEVVASANRTGENLDVLVIGDSLVNAGIMTQTLLDNAAIDVMAITLHGIVGTAPNKHEGRGGWTVTNYTTAGPTYYEFTVSGVVVEPNINSTTYSYAGSNFTVQEVQLIGGAGTFVCELDSGSVPTGSGALTKTSGVGDASVSFSAVAPTAANPFYIGGQIDFAQYQIDNSIPTLDVVIISLGINDIFGQTDDAGAITKAGIDATNLEILVSSIRSANPSCRIGIALPTPPANQDSFGFNYGSGQTAARNKRNIFIWNQVFDGQYSGREGSLDFVVPSNVSLDTVNNYPTVTEDANSRNSIQVVRQSNSVHPATSGARQIGDSWFAWIKS